MIMTENNLVFSLLSANLVLYDSKVRRTVGVTVRSSVFSVVFFFISVDFGPERGVNQEDTIIEVNYYLIEKLMMMV